MTTQKKAALTAAKNLRPVKLAKDNWLALKLGSGVLSALLLAPLIRWTVKQK